MMEKYGVDNVRRQQEQALAKARARLLHLSGVLEKTGSQAQEIEMLEDEVAMLEEALSQ